MLQALIAFLLRLRYPVPASIFRKRVRSELQKRMDRLPGFSHTVFALAAVVVIAAGVRAASAVLSPIFLGAFFAILLAPVYDWLLHKRLPPALALLLVALGFSGVVLSIAALVGVSAAGFLSQVGVYSVELNARLTELRAWLIDLGALDPDFAPMRLLNINNAIALVRGTVSNLSSFLVTFVFVLLLVLFLLAESKQLDARLRAAVGDDHPLRRRLDAYGGAIGRYFGLRVYINFVVALLVGVGLWLVGIDYAPLWAVLLFFLSFVPYAGIFIASAPPVLLALLESGLGLAALVIVFITAVNMTLENVVAPNILGRDLNVSPTLVFISFFVFTWLLGAAGALLALPATLLLLFVLSAYESTAWLAALAGFVDGENEEPRSP